MINKLFLKIEFKFNNQKKSTNLTHLKINLNKKFLNK